MREYPSIATRIKRGAKAILYAGLLTAVTTGCIPSSRAQEAKPPPTTPQTPIARVIPEATPTLVPAEIWPDVTVSEGEEVHITKANSYLYPYLGMEEMHLYQSPFPNLPLVAIGSIWQTDVKGRDGLRNLSFQQLVFPVTPNIKYEERPRTPEDFLQAPEYQVFVKKVGDEMEREARRFSGSKKTVEIMLRPDSLTRKVLVFQEGYVFFTDETSSPQSIMMVNWHFKRLNNPLRNMQ
jgi:hypothetical protein